MDLLGLTPAFDLQNTQWPILGEIYDGPPARLIAGEVCDALIGEGCRLEGGRGVRSVLGRGVRLGKGAEIQGSGGMGYAEIGTGVKLTGVIVDRFNLIPGGTPIGVGSGRGQSP